MKYAKSTNRPFGLWLIAATYLIFSVTAGWALWGTFVDVRQQLRSDLYGQSVDIVRTAEMTTRYLDEIRTYQITKDPALKTKILQRLEILKGREMLLLEVFSRLVTDQDFVQSFTTMLRTFTTAVDAIERHLDADQIDGEYAQAFEDQLFAAENEIGKIFVSSQDYIQTNVGRQYKIQEILSIFLVGLIVTFLIVLGGLVLALKKLHTAQRTAQKANKDKSAFLAATSHDMRQPLQAMSLFLYALKNGETNPANREVIDLLEKSAASLSNILNSLLDISRLESGVVKIEKRVSSVASIFDQLANEFAPVAMDKRLRLDFVPSSLFIYSDPTLLENILRNLIANAIKYTDKGRIVVGCRLRSGNLVEIQVLDTGKGIATEQQVKIYDEFYQLNGSPGNSAQGLGLGLSIVRRVAALLEHDLSMSSELGHGSLFSVTVPLIPGLKKHTLEIDTSNIGTLLKSLSIIVIDDEEVVRKSLSRMLSAMNHSVVDAPFVDDSNDDEMKRFPAQVPDVIVADYRLENGKTGIEAISKLCGHYKQNIPAILLTGDTAPDRLQTLTQSGYALLHKPVNGDDLLLQISRVLAS